MTINKIVYDSASEVTKFFISRYEDEGVDVTLYGMNGLFDSLDLVRFVLLLETKVSAETGKDISLTSDKSLSLYKSPFNTMRSVIEFINKVLNE